MEGFLFTLLVWTVFEDLGGQEPLTSFPQEIVGSESTGLLVQNRSIGIVA